MCVCVAVVWYLCDIIWVVPVPSNSGNEGLVRDSLLKMVHNPGGHWHPGKGDNPRYYVNRIRKFQIFGQHTSPASHEVPMILAHSMLLIFHAGHV